VGVIRLTERLVKSDPLLDRDERRLVRTITNAIEPYVSAVAKTGFARVIGTSGTILSLGQMAACHMTGHEPSELRNLRVPATEIHQLRKRVVSLDLRQRLRLPGLDPRRVDFVVAGAVLLDTILRRLGATELTLCDLALREGLILDYIRRNRTQITQVDQYPDPRRRSVIELAERCRYFPEHAQHVARLSLSLFDQTRGSHGLTDREREWLEYAALLHDIGGHISYEKHHRHSHYLITNGDLRGFDPDEIAIIALVARYHRRSPPSKTHRDFAQLPAASRRTVRALSAILRLAEGLDRSHSSAIRDAVLTERAGDCLVQLKADGDAELEVWAAPKHAGPFERMLGKRVSFVAAPGDAAAPSSRARTDIKAPSVKTSRAPRPRV
jgi:exopolyphosphatase/guanosine-5'-triphosphate,3'-diphosphate pyrophosphatase